MQKRSFSYDPLAGMKSITPPPTRDKPPSQGSWSGSHVTVALKPVFTTEPQITEVTSNSVNISWIVEDDFGAPEVQISLNDKVVYKGKDTQYQITDLNPDTTYPVVLIASDLNNNLMKHISSQFTHNPLSKRFQPALYIRFGMRSLIFKSKLPDVGEQLGLSDLQQYMVVSIIFLLHRNNRFSSSPTLPRAFGWSWSLFWFWSWSWGLVRRL